MPWRVNSLISTILFAAKDAVEATVPASEFAGQGQLCP
jgi:hypothetical protein